MAYTTISKLPQQGLDNLLPDDYLLISSGESSYKVGLADMKDFFASIYNLDEFVIENKEITSITNTIHATALHKKMIAGQAGLKRGDLVTLQPHDHELSDTIGLEELPTCVKADNRVAPAIGIVKGFLGEDGYPLPNDTIGELYQETVVINSGIIDPIDTSSYADGTILYLGEDGVFTDIRPVNTEGEDRIIQSCGFVLFADDNEEVSGTGAMQVLFGNPEQHAHDVFFNGWEYGDLQARDTEHGIAEVFSLCNQEIVTVDHVEIVDNAISLPIVVDGDIVLNSVRIWDTIDGNAYDEYSATVGQFYNTIEFDELDNLNGKYATLSYLAAKPRNWTLPWE